MEREPGDEFFDWVTFSPQTFTAAPNEWKTIKMTVAPPLSASLGYYYAVTFGRATESAPGAEQTALVGSTATLVLLDVKVPFAKREAVIQSFSSDESWYEFLPATFHIIIKNTGNVHVAPTGNIFITRGATEVGQLKINQIYRTRGLRQAAIDGARARG